MLPSNGSSGNAITEKIERLKSAIWQKRPILGEIMKKHGDKPLYKYAKEFDDINPTPILDDRRYELIKTSIELMNRRLGADIAIEAGKQIKRFPLVSTADHHGPIDHPLWINANIISALNQINREKLSLQYLMVFSFASVSVNNASAFPRGILFHSEKNGEGELIRFPILPDKLKMGVVYNTRGFNPEDLDNSALRLEKMVREQKVSKERGILIKDVLDEYFRTDEILKLPDLNSQITLLNFRLWHDIFHKADGSPPNKRMPDLIYFDIETLTRELLIRYHLFSDSLISKLLFAPEFRPEIIKYFNNIPGAFSVEEDWGTWFFWGLDEKMRRVRLFSDGKTLFSQDGTIKINMDPASIAEALTAKTIYPSMMTCYLIISLYYGMKCLGGFCQVHDLTMLKYAWFKILNKLGYKKEAEAILPIQTRELGGDGMALSYSKTSDGRFIMSTGIDMLIDGNDTSPDQYFRISQNVSLTEIMNPMLPEIYTVLYPFDTREADLSSVTPEQIMEVCGLTKKLAGLSENTSNRGAVKITGISVKKPAGEIF